MYVKKRIRPRRRSKYIVDGVKYKLYRYGLYLADSTNFKIYMPILSEFNKVENNILRFVRGNSLQIRVNRAGLQRTIIRKIYTCHVQAIRVVIRPYISLVLSFKHRKTVKKTDLSVLLFWL